MHLGRRHGAASALRRISTIAHSRAPISQTNPQRAHISAAALTSPLPTPLPPRCSPHEHRHRHPDRRPAPSPGSAGEGGRRCGRPGEGSSSTRPPILIKQSAPDCAQQRRISGNHDPLLLRPLPPLAPPTRRALPLPPPRLPHLRTHALRHRRAPRHHARAARRLVRASRHNPRHRSPRTLQRPPRPRHRGDRISQGHPHARARRRRTRKARPVAQGRNHTPPPRRPSAAPLQARRASNAPLALL